MFLSTSPKDAQVDFSAHVKELYNVNLLITKEEIGYPYTLFYIQLLMGIIPLMIPFIAFRP